jgi:glycerol kinase
MSRYILSVDQSTSATKAMLFDEQGNLLTRESVPHQQYYPREGFVEHDAVEIYGNTVAVMRGCVEKSGLSVSELAAIAITNQRETVLVWDRDTGKPIANAAVWQCLRGREICAALIAEGHGDMVKQKTGLLLDPYFSASKIKWILDNTAGARERADAGGLAFGTIDSWLVWNLTGGTVHVTDYSNASRTLLFDISRLAWSPELLELFDIPASMTPILVASDVVVGTTKKGEPFGVELPIAGLLGDSHAALFGETCFDRAAVKTTYGTGSSIMMNVGPEPIESKRGIVTSVGYGLSSGTAYAFEGNIHSSGGTIQWLVEDVGLIGDAAESSTLSRSVDSTEGVYLVPAFVGLGAPYWDNEARAALVGMSRSTAKAHIVRAAEESIAYQVRDLLSTMCVEASADVAVLSADGGATRDEFLMQFQSDILNVAVQCAGIEEVSALGSAYAAGLAVGIWSDLDELKGLNVSGRKYVPRMAGDTRERLISGWREAVGRTLWKPS